MDLPAAMNKLYNNPPINYLMKFKIDKTTVSHVFQINFPSTPIQPEA